MSSKGTSKRASIAKSRATPPPLANLCHRALIEGVLQLHDGLPDDVLGLLQKHPAAWKQLTEAVLRSRGRLEVSHKMTKDSTLLLVLDGRDRLPGYSWQQDYTTLVPASELPEWLFLLLAFYLEAIAYADFDNHDVVPAKCGMGAYQIDLTERDDVVPLYCEAMSIDRFTGGALQEMVEIFHERFFLALGMNKDLLYRDQIAEEAVMMAAEEGGNAEDYMDQPLSYLVREYSEHTDRIMQRKLLKEHEYFLENQLPDMWSGPGRRMDEATYLRAPFAKLFLNPRRITDQHD